MQGGVKLITSAIIRDVDEIAWYYPSILQTRRYKLGILSRPYKLMLTTLPRPSAHSWLHIRQVHNYHYTLLSILPRRD